jgi:hypothetical protein
VKEHLLVVAPVIELGNPGFRTYVQFSVTIASQVDNIKTQQTPNLKHIFKVYNNFLRTTTVVFYPEAQPPDEIPFLS